MRQYGNCKHAPAIAAERVQSNWRVRKVNKLSRKRVCAAICMWAFVVFFHRRPLQLRIAVTQIQIHFFFIYKIIIEGESDVSGAGFRSFKSIPAHNWHSYEMQNWQQENLRSLNWALNESVFVSCLLCNKCVDLVRLLVWTISQFGVNRQINRKL